MLVFCYDLSARAVEDARVAVTSASLRLEIPSSLSATQKNLALSAGKKMVGNVEAALKTQLPTEIYASFRESPVVIELNSAIPYDGFFHPSTPRRVSIHPRVFSNPGVEELTLHELFHALHFQTRPNEENWLKEGLAQAFSLVNKRNFGGYGVEQSLSDSSMPLMGAYDHAHAPASWYGKNLLFVRYLLRRCTHKPEDSLKLLWALAGFTPAQERPESHGLRGRAWISEVLANLSAQDASIGPDCASFENLFRAFALAFTINRSSGKAGEPYLLFPTTLQTSVDKSAFKELEPFQFKILGQGAKRDEALKKYLSQNDAKVEAFAISEIYPFDPTPIGIHDIETSRDRLRILVLRLE